MRIPSQHLWQVPPFPLRRPRLPTSLKSTAASLGFAPANRENVRFPTETSSVQFPIHHGKRRRFTTTLYVTYLVL